MSTGDQYDQMVFHTTDDEIGIFHNYAENMSMLQCQIKSYNPTRIIDFILDYMFTNELEKKSYLDELQKQNKHRLVDFMNSKAFIAIDVLESVMASKGLVLKKTSLGSKLWRLELYRNP